MGGRWQELNAGRAAVESARAPRVSTAHRASQTHGKHSCLPTRALPSHPGLSVSSWLPGALFLLLFYGKSPACWPEVSQLAAAWGVGGQGYRGPCSAGSWLWPGTGTPAALGVTDCCRPPPSGSGPPFTLWIPNLPSGNAIHRFMGFQCLLTTSDVLGAVLDAGDAVWTRLGPCLRASRRLVGRQTLDHHASSSLPIRMYLMKGRQDSERV